MRIVFIGMVEFSRVCLEEIISCGVEVGGIVTLKEKVSGFYTDYCDLEPIARKYNIPILKVENISQQESIDFIKEANADVIFVLGFSQIVLKEIFEIAPKGCIGSHPSALPKNRGHHPIIWALINGLKESALTFFHINERVDSGDIVMQKPFVIDDKDDSKSIYERVLSLAKEMLREILPLLDKGCAPRIPQDEARASYGRKRNESDGLLNWNSSAVDLHNLIRALTRPYAGADIYFLGNKYKVWKSNIKDLYKSPGFFNEVPGTVIDITSDGIVVMTNDGVITLQDVDNSLRELLNSGDVLG